MKNISWSIAPLLLMASCTQKDDQQPNIVFILADDFGYMDAQSYAQRMTGVEKSDMYYETPNIDRLSDEGISFSYAYANQLSSPTRASLLTGKYAGKLGFTTATPLRKTYYNQNMKVPEGQYPHDVLEHFDPIDIERAWINGKTNTALASGTLIDNGLDEISLAEALPDYHSAFIGKWHVGGHGAEGYSPADQGFDPIAWYDGGGSLYFNWREGWNNRSKSYFPDMPQEEWKMGDAGEETGEKYLSDDLTVQALRYLDKRAEIKGQPFFLYFNHYAVHSPWQAKAEDLAYFDSKDTKDWNGHKDPRYAGMVRGLDNSVGKILDKLEETGLEDNTLVIFMSDNGGWDSRVSVGGMATNNSPLRGGKACLSEGGIRVPLIFRWKGEINEGIWSDIPVDCTDLFPTIVQAAGYDIEGFYNDIGIDGRSLLPLFKDIDNSKADYNHNTRYWHYPFNVSVYSPFDGEFLTPRSAIMEDNFKLIFDWHGRLKLFDIKNDIEENYNLVQEMPEKTREMYGKLMTWLDENVDKQYWPVLNPEYDASKEVRKDAPFIDLYKAWKEGKDIVELTH